jgi:recombinational DNA repair ATPase RecF
MLLESLEAHCFRNLSGKVSWGAGLNIIYGDNGQGKTNWLEAIYLLATSKSFRTQKPQEAVRFDEELVRRDANAPLMAGTKNSLTSSRRPVSDADEQHVLKFDTCCSNHLRRTVSEI